MNGPVGSTIKVTTQDKIALLKADLEYQRVILPQMIEMQDMFAQVARAKYLSLVEAGFSKEEALTLCK
jgi:hypothetical protein